MITDEAEAVLFILDKRAAGRPIEEEDWQKVFSSEGYVRLKQRETGMKRPFEESDFKTFVLSPQLLERRKALAETLEKWKKTDMAAGGRRALKYLPAGARIRAKIYPVIKPRDNSFVFDLKNDPAVFLYLNPEKPRDKFENDVVHEMHHIGFGTACPTARTSQQMERLPENVQTVLKWTGAFGEGFAMLAAAGGPDIHPHSVSDPEERARWDKDLANFNDDLKRVERFFSDVLEGKLSEQETNETAFSFYGIQGPWYTVGWKMAVTIEKTHGRTALIECMCDQRKLFETYNRAARKQNGQKRDEPLALWSESLVKAVKRQKPGR